MPYVYHNVCVCLFLLFYKDGFFVWTPLMMAARTGHYQICQLLLEHGAVLDLPQEVSVLHSAGM